MLCGMARIAIIGGGSIGEALLAGLLRAGRQVKDLVVAEKNSTRAQYLADKYSVRVTSVRDAVDTATYVVVAVKPADVQNLIDGALFFQQCRADENLVGSLYGNPDHSYADRNGNGCRHDRASQDPRHHGVDRGLQRSQGPDGDGRQYVESMDHDEGSFYQARQ